MNIYETISTMAQSLQPQLVAQRRDFHKHAETGWLEMRTSSIIARKLTDMGYEVLTGEDVCLKEARMGVPEEAVLEQAYARAVAQGADPQFVQRTRGGMTGVIGILRCGEGPTVAMRFDIDALGVNEATEDTHLPAREGFVSINPGAMHACGHDGHAVIGLGVAKVLMSLKDQLRGTIKLIFQPAEEGVRGAKSIVEKGHLDGVDFFIGSHITGTSEASGDAKVIPGSYGSLATAKYDVIYHGVSAHAGGSPHKGANALLAAAAATLNLYAIPRHGAGASRINVGTLHAGSGRNVIADHAKMELEIRGSTTEINNYMCHYAENIIAAAAKMYDCTFEMKLMGAADTLSSTRQLADRIQRVCEEKLGLSVFSPITSSSGSEDISYMMNRVQEQGGQAVFMRPLTPTAAGAHNRRYDFGEEVIQNAVTIFCGTVVDILCEN